MTRINVGVSAGELSDKHLIAEHRELKRIPNTIASGKANLNIEIPKNFTLGKGHIRFFYNKLWYLKKRYDELFIEGIRRGFNFTYFGSAWEGIDPMYMNDYKPTEADRNLILQRIKERS